MKENYFNVDSTAYRDTRKRSETVLAIYAGEKSRKNPDGTTSAFLRFPALIITEYVSDGDDFAKTVCKILEENAHRFFSSATENQSQLEEPKRSEGDEVDPQH